MRIPPATITKRGPKRSFTAPPKIMGIGPSPFASPKASARSAPVTAVPVRSVSRAASADPKTDQA